MPEAIKYQKIKKIASSEVGRLGAPKFGRSAGTKLYLRMQRRYMPKLRNSEIANFIPYVSLKKLGGKMREFYFRFGKMWGLG